MHGILILHTAQHVFESFYNVEKENFETLANKSTTIKAKRVGYGQTGGRGKSHSGRSLRFTLVQVFK